MRKLQRGFTLIELMIVVAIIGILAAIAIPNFVRFQAKSKQSEAKANLKAIFTAKKAYFAEHDTYACAFCDWAQESGNMYTYKAGASTVQSQKPAVATITGASNIAAPADATTSFTATAQANIDADATVDGWMINDMNLLCNGGIASGACDTTSTDNDVTQ